MITSVFTHCRYSTDERVTYVMCVRYVRANFTSAGITHTHFLILSPTCTLPSGRPYSIKSRLGSKRAYR